MMRSTGLVVSAVVSIGAFVAITTTACGNSATDSGFSSGGTSGASGTSGANGSGGPFGSSGASGASGGPDAGKPDECKKMDIVFLVDNSGSMQQEQTNLAANFPKFVQVINDYKTKSGDALDFRLAVMSSDDGKEKGKYNTTRAKSAPSGCNAGPSRPWLERPDGDVAGFFACRAQFGTDGSNIERPLENMALSVTTAATSNSANGMPFVREDALLAFVVLTDEDEGGTEDDPARAMAAYPAVFDQVKGERGRWAAAAIAGPTACQSTFGNAAEATRLKGFITEVGKNGVFSSICTGDLTTGLTAALTTFDQACRDFPAGPVK